MWQQRNEQTLQRGLNIIKRIPFTRAVSLTGSLAEKRANEGSDIDLFIQIAPGHLWLGRFLVTLVIHLAGIRRTDTDIAGKICLNWLATFNAPAEQKGRVFELLWQEEKSPLAKRAFEFLLGWPALEQLAKKYQTTRIERDPRTHQAGSQVRYSDTELGFHPPKQK